MSEAGSPSAPPIEILVVCTGNAARSVMAGLMLERHAEDAGLRLHLTTAGTHAVEGQPVSWRTRAALAQMEQVEEAGLGRHRSRQLMAEHLDAAELVIGMETDHIRWVRRFRPEAATRAATLRRLCRTLPPAPPGLGKRVAALRLEHVALEPWEDVEDPAGQELEVYVDRAREIWELSGQLVDRLGSGSRPG